MEDLSGVFRLLAGSQVSLWVLYFLLCHYQQRLVWLVVLTCLCFLSYLLLPFLLIADSIPPVIFLAALFSNFIPALVWLLSYFLAHDQQRIPLSWFQYRTKVDMHVNRT